MKKMSIFSILPISLLYHRSLTIRCVSVCNTSRVLRLNHDFQADTSTTLNQSLMYATPHPAYPYDPSSLTHLTSQHDNRLAIASNQLGSAGPPRSLSSEPTAVPNISPRSRPTDTQRRKQRRIR